MLFAVMFFALLGSIILASGLQAETFGGHVKRFAFGMLLIGVAVMLLK